MKCDPGIQTTFPWYEGQPELAPCSADVPDEMRIDWAALGMLRDVPSPSPAVNWAPAHPFNQLEQDWMWG